MTDLNPLAPRIVFHFWHIALSEAVVTTWAIMAVLGLACWLLTRRLSPTPGRLQAAAELLVEAMADQIEATMRVPPRPFLPLIGTIFLFLLVANLSALLPGVHAPTARLETAGALSLVVFFSTHVFGIRRRGLRTYLEHYLKPTPLLLPLTLLSELTRTLSLMVRLFGNIMSHELIIAVVAMLAALLVPVPIMALGLLIGAVQAYIFAILAAVFLGAAVGSVEAH